MARLRSTDRQIVLLDQEPLRREMASQCGKAMARLEKAKAEWKRFQMEDKGAFSGWSAATFGPLLSRLRETDEALREQEALILDVQMEMFYGGSRSPRTAYARVQKRRDNPPPPVEQPASGWHHGSENEPAPSGDGAGADEDFTTEEEVEEVLMFEAYVVEVLGLIPERMSDRKYQRLFAEFRADCRRQASTPRGAAGPGPAPAKSVQSRVKELYRVLVRRLHPDTGAEASAEVRALWHDVQDAYRQGNVERLEMLLALTDLQANEAGTQTTLAQMRLVLAELRRAFQALRRNLKEAQTDPAWGFSRSTDHVALERRLRFELQATLQWKQSELRRLAAIIAGWAPVSKKRAGQKRAVRPRAGSSF